MYMKINMCIIYFSQELNTLNGKVRVEITIVESINIFPYYVPLLQNPPAKMY